MLLNPTETYAIARAVKGMDWQHVEVNPLLKQMLSNMRPQDSVTLMQLLGTEVTAKVFAVDPNSPPPAAPKSEDNPVDIFVPALPAEVCLSDKAIQAAEKVGKWIDDCTAWAAKRSPMTPHHFLFSGALWAVGLAIARRCALHTYEPLHPQFYMLWVAPTSRYKKSTGLKAIRDLINTAMPHMLFPEEMTPESFINALAGQLPCNYEKLAPYDRHLLDLGLPHASQRGIMIDEASSLFGSSKKDYMQGTEEMLLRGFDSPDVYRRMTQHDGFLAVRDQGLSILGVTTPPALTRTLSKDAWETGLMARFITLYPDGPMTYNLPDITPEEYCPPADLVGRLARLHQDHLPKPPSQIELAGGHTPIRQSITACIDSDAYEIFKCYTQAVTHTLLESKQAPDTRLHGNYSRLHVYAGKVALAMAVMDWSDAGGFGLPRITLGHMARGVQVAESWRSNWHRLLSVVDITQENKDQDKLLGYLARFTAGRTRRELVQGTHLTYKAASTLLDALIESGDVEVVEQQSTRGKKSVVYRLVNC